MAFFSGGTMRPILVRAGAWLYAIMLRKGWRRWVLLVVALILGIFLASLTFDGVDYRKNPSALVPGSIAIYAETGDLDLFLNTVNGWKGWLPERLPTKEQPGNLTAAGLAGMLGAHIPGLGTRTPLSWLAAAKTAAYAVAGGEAGDPEAWALYLAFADPGEAIRGLDIEPGLTLNRHKADRENAVYRLTGGEGGELFFAVVGPWFIVSSSAKLPEFAMESLKKPETSLGESGILMDWRRNVVVRGMFDPSYLASSPAGGGSRFAFAHAWMTPAARLAFTARFSGGDGLALDLSTRALSDHTRGGGMWFLFKLVFGVIALACAALAIATLLAIVGWGAWLKLAAVRLGVAPAKEPAPVQPSSAFRVDSGLETETGKASASPQEEVIAVETVVEEPAAGPETTQGNL